MMLAQILKSPRLTLHALYKPLRLCFDTAQVCDLLIEDSVLRLEPSLNGIDGTGCITEQFGQVELVERLANVFLERPKRELEVAQQVRDLQKGKHRGLVERGSVDGVIAARVLVRFLLEADAEFEDSPAGNGRAVQHMCRRILKSGSRDLHRSLQADLTWQPGEVRGRL